MKLYAPKYYKKFICIADKCKHSCCVGWEIDIDNNTYSRYNSLTCEYGKIIRESIEDDDIPHFKLVNNDKCPHLSEDGLCKIIKNLGEDALCNICREHPRFYNFTNAGKEVGIGMACEEACRIILNSDDFDSMIELGDCDSDLFVSDYNALEDRSTVYQILKKEHKNINEKIALIYEYFNIDYCNFAFSDILCSLEYLNENDITLFSKAHTISWNSFFFDELTRILAYYVYRHCSEANDFCEFVISLNFAVFCTGLISSISDKTNLYDVARIVSEEIEYSQDNIDKVKEFLNDGYIK